MNKDPGSRSDAQPASTGWENMDVRASASPNTPTAPMEKPQASTLATSERPPETSQDKQFRHEASEELLDVNQELEEARNQLNKVREMISRLERPDQTQYASVDGDIRRVGPDLAKLKEEESRLSTIVANLEAKVGNASSIDSRIAEKRAEAFASASTSVESTPEQSITPETNLDKQAWEFAKNRTPEAVMGAYSRETVAINNLLKSLERLRQKQSEESKGKKPLFGKGRTAKEIDGTIKELNRYGYQGGMYDSDSTFGVLVRDSVRDGIARKEKETAMLMRASDWKKLDTVLKGDHGKEAIKKLRSKGLKRVPETWDDKDFTTEEIFRIWNTVANFAETQ